MYLSLDVPFKGRIGIEICPSKIKAISEYRGGLSLVTFTNGHTLVVDRPVDYILKLREECV